MTHVNTVKQTTVKSLKSLKKKHQCMATPSPTPFGATSFYAIGQNQKCLENGFQAPLVDPTAEDCWAYCSINGGNSASPAYFNYYSQGSTTSCECNLGQTCTLVYDPTYTAYMMSILATMNPTMVPTSNPTMIPTDTPTSAPSAMPSMLPTAAPSQLPTSQPSKVPTNMPSKLPTKLPTSRPTMVSSCFAFYLPTYLPTYLCLSLSIHRYLPSYLPRSPLKPLSLCPSPLVGHGRSLH